MRIWLDAQLSPSIASWIESSFDVDEAFAVQIDEALRSKKDREIFERARQVGAVVMTKDHDFVELLD